MQREREIQREREQREREQGEREQREREIQRERERSLKIEYQASQSRQCRSMRVCSRKLRNRLSPQRKLFQMLLRTVIITLAPRGNLIKPGDLNSCES